ncbi:hypothetical protein N0V90_010446 [Kalmusia sp. IMI 367209]|nr:hypothetical protein N0V90_010446 [Kalmusia sp. IMI 367209]
MPRPDLEKLGIKYRRIPILAIGRDIYLDTRLIIRKLEERFPDGKLGGDNPDQRFVQKLLERYMIEGPVFREAAGLVPSAFLKDPKFAEDRRGFLGRNWTPEEMEEGRPECLLYVRNLFDLLETTILADGRKWILGTAKPTLADIEAIWPLDWAVNMKSMPSHVVSAIEFPNVYAWIARFRAALDDGASSAAEEPTVMSGEDAVKLIRTSTMSDAQDAVKENDPQGFEQGTKVEMYASDWGTEHKDSGRLVGLASDEVTIMVEGMVELRLHAPRTGFRVTAVGRDVSIGSTKL